MTPSELFTYKDIRQKIEQQFIDQGWITVSDRYIYCALIPDNYLENSLITEYWDINEYSPKLWTSCNRTKPKYEYKRYENGIEPLVIIRNPKGKYPSEADISEEFILYFDLRKNTNSDYYDWELVTLSYDGDDIVVVRCLDHKIEVSVRYLKHFIAIKEMNLAIYFNYERFINSDTFDSQYSEPTGIHSDLHTIFRYSVQQSYDFSKGNICSELMGKLLIGLIDNFKEIISQLLNCELDYIADVLDKVRISKRIVPLISIVYADDFNPSDIETIIDILGIPFTYNEYGEHFLPKSTKNPNRDSDDMLALIANSALYNYIAHPNKYRCCPLRFMCLQSKIPVIKEECFDYPWQGKECPITGLCEYIGLKKKEYQWTY